MKPPRILGSRDFWFAATIALLGLVSVFLWLQNRSVLNEVRVQTEVNNAELVQVCSTITTLDLAIVLPLLSETREAIAFLPPGPQLTRARRIESNLQIAHEELSKTAPCAKVR